MGTLNQGYSVPISIIRNKKSPFESDKHVKNLLYQIIRNRLGRYNVTNK